MKVWRWAWVCLALAVPARAAFEPLRYNDDFDNQRTSCSSEESCLKSVPWRRSSWKWSLGGEARWRYESTFNPEYGSAQQDPWGAFLQRYATFVDLSDDRGWRLFFGMSSALQSGRAGGASPVDANRLDLSNAFVEWQGELAKGGTVLSLRLGVQELRFGSGRLVDARDGPNVRRAFQGGQAIFQSGVWTATALRVSPRSSLPGVLDDRTVGGQNLAGVYATRLGERLGVDVYALHLRDDRASYLEGPASESRWSVGIRAFGQRGAMDWDWEAIRQWGHWGDRRIAAWTLASETGISLRNVAARPRISILLAAASGDRDPGDGRLGTFHPLYPRGNYFGDDATLGPRNFINGQFQFQFNPAANWTASASISRFLRFSKADGIYTPSGGLSRAPGASDARWVANVHSVTTEWEFRPGWKASTVLSYFESGDFLRETGTAEPMFYLELSLLVRF
ncbi:alginate export family protein [Arenimonas aestuarii]